MEKKKILELALNDWVLKPARFLIARHGMMIFS
jgi:hypothetical protein